MTIRDLVFIVTLGYGVSFFCIFTVIYLVYKEDKPRT